MSDEYCFTSVAKYVKGLEHSEEEKRHWDRLPAQIASRDGIGEHHRGNRGGEWKEAQRVFAVP